MPVLRFTSSYRVLLTLGEGFGLPLPTSDSRSKAKSCLQVLIALFVYFKIFCAMQAVIYNDRFEDMIYAVAVLMFSLTGAFLTLFYAVFRERFQRLVDRLDETSNWFARAQLTSGDYYRQLYTSDARLLTLATRAMCVATYICPLVTCVSVPLIDYMRGTYRTHMAVPAHCTFEYTHTRFYECFVLLEMLGLHFPAIQKLVNEFIMISMFKMQVSCFKYLSEILKQIQRDFASDFSRPSRQKLKIWIKMHQSAIRNAHELIDFFSPVIILYYLSMIGILSGGVFYQLNATDSNKLTTAVLGVYMLITVIHLYVQCYMADILTSEAENLGVEVYRMPWYVLEPRSRGLVALAMRMANRPIYVVAYQAPAFTLDKQSFVAFMKSSVSAYMGFSTIMEMNEPA